MKLVVLITGLVLLAPDTANGRLHLFLPQMDMSYPEAEHHTPFLRYTTATRPHDEPLAGWSLDLGSLARPGRARGLPASIIRTDTLYRGIPGTWVTGTPSRRVQGRLTLPWPNKFVVKDSARWRLVRGSRVQVFYLTNAVALEYDSLTLSGVDWKLTSLQGGNGEKSIPPLRPQDSDTMHITNVPPDEGERLESGNEGVHFQGYVHVLRRSLADQFRPRPRIFLADDPRKLWGMSPYNCMLASAPID